MSGNEERKQTFLLIGEVVETAKESTLSEPWPSFAGVLAARLVLVLNDPLHFMFTKANQFLNKSPTWNLSKLPSYWVDKLLLQGPSVVNARHLEIEWIMSMCLEGLRTRKVSCRKS